MKENTGVFKGIPALALVLGLLLTACPTGSDDNSENGNGTDGDKTGSFRVINESSVTLLAISWGGKSLSQGEDEFEPGAISPKITVSEETTSYIRFVKKYYDMSNEAWIRAECRTQEVITVSPGNDIEFRFINGTIVVDENDSSNSGTLESIEVQLPGLTVKNNSSYDLQQVVWQRSGFSVTPIVQISKNAEGNFSGEGSGYLYFTRKTPAINLRTITPITIQKSEKGGSTLYTITDDTEFIEVGSATNEGALKDIQKKVVFFDDSENEEIKENYGSTSGVFSYNAMIGDNVNAYNPKNGNYSIAIGGDSGTAQLSLSGIVLESAAKLSFYYANKRNFFVFDSEEDKNAAFYINDVEQFTLKSTDTNWTRAEYNLEPGTYTFVWKKTDGSYDSGSSFFQFFLSLDDILIEYE